MSNLIDLQNLIASARKEASYAAGQARITAAENAEIKKNQAQLYEMLKLTAASRSGSPQLQHIEDVPGRRVPYDLLVAVPIAANLNAETQQSVVINQDGPFVAVARQAWFVSQFAFQYTNPENSNTTQFQGRSFGRIRPIHSAWDLYDGVPRSEVVQAVPAPGGGAPHIISPSNASSFRSMQPDFMFEMRNEGFAYPRSNIYVPSAGWTKQINSPYTLGALDLFERGETITFKVNPLHPNNPAYGNVSGFTGGGNWPFINSQFDAVEGISDPVLGDVATDPITRLPQGVLYIGLHGFKIIQPPGAGPY